VTAAPRLTAMTLALSVLALAIGCHKKPAVPEYVSPPLGAVTKNWISRAATGRYFVFEDGKDFFPIGTSIEGSAVQYDSAFPEKTDPSFEQDFETLFTNMKLRGENVLRTSPEGLAAWDSDDRLRGLIESKALRFLESPVGRFDQAYAARIHALIALAAKHDIFLQLDIGPHSCGVNNHFQLYPYHEVNGGPVRRLADLRTDATAKTLWKNRIRYMVDTFGNTDRIFAWELWNEIDIPACGKGNAQESAAWVEEMGTFLRDYERSRYGKSHLVGLSSGVGTIPYEFFFTTAGTDLLQAHDYSAIRLSYNPVDIALQTHTAVIGFLARTSKPFFENERAAMELGEPFKPLVAEIEHAQEMAYLASGASGAGATWSYPRLAKSELRPYRVAQRKILDGLALANVDAKPWEASSSNPKVVPMVTGDGSTMIGWLLHDNAIDYDIEAVRVWQRNYAAVPDPRALIPLNKWLRVQRAHGSCSAVDEAGFKASLADVFRRNFGAAGEGHADSYFRNPQGFVWFGPFAQLNGPKRTAFTTEVTQALATLRAALEAAEIGCSSLDALYQSHPQVSTTLSLGNLIAGPHELTWYDDATGAEVKKESATGTTMTFNSPPFRRSITFVIRPGS